MMMMMMTMKKMTTTMMMMMTMVATMIERKESAPVCAWGSNNATGQWPLYAFLGDLYLMHYDNDDDYDNYYDDDYDY